MTRPMQADDLGDPRVFEDEAIREQAARLQLHLGNLEKRILAIGRISPSTEHRTFMVRMAAIRLHDNAAKLNEARQHDHPL